MRTKSTGNPEPLVMKDYGIIHISNAVSYWPMYSHYGFYSKKVLPRDKFEVGKSEWGWVGVPRYITKEKGWPWIHSG